MRSVPGAPRPFSARGDEDARPAARGAPALREAGRRPKREAGVGTARLSDRASGPAAGGPESGTDPATVTGDLEPLSAGRRLGAGDRPERRTIRERREGP